MSNSEDTIKTAIILAFAELLNANNLFNETNLDRCLDLADEVADHYHQRLDEDKTLLEYTKTSAEVLGLAFGITTRVMIAHAFKKFMEEQASIN